MANSKIPKLVVSNVEKLSKQMVPTVMKIASKAGIQNVGLPDMKMPDVCLPINEVEKLINIRNNLMAQLNSVFTIVDSASKIAKPLDPSIKKVKDTIKALKTAEMVALGILKVWPTSPTTPVPGALINGIFTLDTINKDLPPVVYGLTNQLTAITKVTDFANTKLLILKNLLLSIDMYLKKCHPNADEKLTPINPKLANLDIELKNGSVNNLNSNSTTNNANNISNNSTNLYEGFILDIEEEQYSPTVKRRRAVAKNKDNIVLLQTPWTFSTDTQTLIAEIKLVIDSSDLKAY